MKNLDSLAPFIKTYAGETVGSFIILVLIILTVYKTIFDSGLFQHLFILIRFRRWKIDKEIKEVTELINHGSLNEYVKNKYIDKRRALYLQKQLLTKEDRIEILDILSSYEDEKKAVRLFDSCKKVLEYCPNKKTLDFKTGYHTTPAQAEKHKSIAFYTYWILALPAAAWVLYEYYHLLFKQPPNTDSNLYVLFIFSLYTGWVFLVAFCLRYFLKRANACELLGMKKIKMTKLIY
ncbi:hypothetical protein ACEZKA_002980 [Acinetobacter baumannii]|uniref:hypothetical protein n=1 Tax=Acinetobacter calcoaceticus/baumannii complex TaxID=909768 RepID=UPI00044998FA|nr:MULTISPECIES: hypothetical protein [Acinetobacter calcoaceticus/baumannii complex]EKT9380064.1 hypothetical protein [Acinetobacter baumannii]EKU0758745.1 hypothetical protein [Acinetobacter baumannii]EKV8393732.1 hypothetical protein [Acinetobacter baumannii]EKW0730118.1 hypothetical protein [Acinetobacter baumannii]EKW0738234.1 hypothetical protein [Acinetobacter baumannii]